MGITVLYSNLSKHDFTRNIRKDLPACWSHFRPRLGKLRGCTLSTFQHSWIPVNHGQKTFSCICWLLFEAHCFCFWVSFHFHCRHHYRNFITFIWIDLVWIVCIFCAVAIVKFPAIIIWANLIEHVAVVLQSCVQNSSSSALVSVRLPVSDAYAFTFVISSSGCLLLMVNFVSDLLQ